MKYLSVCSGIEAATVAWHPLGWEAVAYSEIEKFPSQVLLHHYPNTPNWGDMTQFKGWPDATINVLVGGTPCQSFSVAGLRKGLDDPRGNLMLTYLAIARRYRPEWLVWENVPGVLSSANGRDFGSFLGGLAECGYGFAYRVLDAQYFGVAQRRKRVFVVANLRDWRRAAAVLFERESLRGDSAPSREAGEEVTPTIRAGAPNGGAGHGAKSGDSKDDLIIPQLAKAVQTPTGGIDREDMHTLIPQIANPLTARMHKGINTTCDEGQTMIAHSLSASLGSEDGTGRGTPLVIAFSRNDDGRDATHNLAPIMRVAGNAGGMLGIATAMAVRRLTPVECERLQGFPDGYTDIQPKGKATPDGPRYKALGNSMAVPCMAWIGERIQMVDKLCSELNNSKGKHETA